MAIVGAEGGDSSDVQSAIAPTQSTPPPPAAGQESGVFAQVSQVAQQAAQQTAQTAQAATQQAVAQQPKLATLPKGQKVAPVPTSPIPEFDFNHDSFDPTLFNQRFTDVVNQFKDKVGTTPSLSVAHDLTRSGLNLDAVSDIAQHILSSQHDMNGSYTVDVHGLPADWKNVINGDELAQLHSKPIVAVQNAPWQGLKWDGEKFLANLNESAPAQFLKREIQKSLQTPEEALALINEIRKSNPAAVARAMGDIARGDFTEALAKVKEQLGDAFNTAFRLPAAQAAQDVATSVSAAHAVAVKTSLGIAKLAGETGFLKMDDNGNIVLGASQGSRIGQDILSIEGKSVSGANVTLTPQAYDQIKKLAAANGAKPESVAWLDPNSPENRNPEGWRRALSVVDMGSLAFAPTLASSLLSGSVENGLLENGVDKRVAHTAGAIVSFLGVGTLPKNLNMLGKIGAVGGGIAGGAQAALTSGGEKDPFMRGEDIATGAAQGVLGGGQLGHHIGVWRAQSSLTHQILSTLRHDDVQAVKNGLKSKLEEQSEQGKALQAEADVHLSLVNDAALKLQELEKKSSTKPQPEDRPKMIGGERESVPGLADWERRQKEVHAMPENTLHQKVVKREALKALDTDRAQIEQTHKTSDAGLQEQLTRAKDKLAKSKTLLARTQAQKAVDDATKAIEDSKQSALERNVVQPHPQTPEELHEHLHGPDHLHEDQFVPQTKDLLDRGVIDKHKVNQEVHGNLHGTNSLNIALHGKMIPRTPITHIHPLEGTEINSTLPPVPEGHVRLYRGEERGKRAESAFEKPLQGRWYTHDPRYATMFGGPNFGDEGVRRVRGQFKFIDVPKNVADLARLEHLRIKNEQAKFETGVEGETPSLEELRIERERLYGLLNHEEYWDVSTPKGIEKYHSEQQDILERISRLDRAMAHAGDLNYEEGYIIPQDYAQLALAIPHEIMDAHVADLEEADHLQRRIEDYQAEVQRLSRVGETGEPMANAINNLQTAVGKLSDLSTPPDPELAKARQAYVDASAAHALAQGRADVLRERVRRQVEGNVDSPVRQASEGLLHVLDRVIPKHATEFGGVALVQATRVMAQEVGNAVKNAFKEIGDTPANHAQLRAAMENHDFIDQITNPKLQQLARDLHALNAGIAARIPESLKVEIIQDYYPRGAGLSRERFERTVRSDNPLPVSTSHLHNRVVPEDEAEVNKAHPGDEYEAYTASMGQALVNHRVRAAVRDAKTGDGKPVFVSFESTTDRVPPDNGLKYTKSTLAGLEGWLETGTHNHLKAMATPVAKDGLGKLYSNFNSYYKTLAMTSLQHFWNQFSAAIGVDPGGNIGSLLKRGQSITHDPRAFAAALEHVYAQPERFIAEVADNMTTNAPHLTPALDALRSVEKQTFGRFEHTLWTSSIRNVQFGIYDTLRAKLRAQHGDAYTPEEYDHAAGYMAGQIVGIMPPQKLAVWERQLQKYLAFAYQWNRKHVTIVGQALPVFGEGRAKAFDPTLNDKTAHLVTEMSRDYLTRYAVTAMAYLYAGQVVLNGTFPSDNKPGHEFDFNWTRLHDMVYGADGQDHYITFPPLMFGNFFHSKVQVMQDALERAGTNTGEGVVKGLANNLANITMPIPSWLIQTFTNLGTEDASGMIGRAYQTSNPFQRNFFGPLAKNEPPKDATDLLGDLGSFFGGFSGLKVSQGAHRPFSPSKIVNEDRRAAALTLARMGIDPALASEADWARAEKELHSGEFLGVNLKQVGEAIAGHPEGTGSAYKAMNQWADQTMNSALIEAGLTQAQIDKARAEGGQPIHLLTPSQERKMFEEHPELQYILNAPPVSDDPTVIKAHADMTKYNGALSYAYSKTADQQKALDAEYESGKISLTEWKSRTHDIRQQEKGAIDDAWHQLTPDEQVKLSRSPEEKGKTDPVIANSPLLAEEQAYWQFRQIASTGNYDQPDGTISPDLRKAQNAYMAGLSADMQQYILNREAQTQTPLQQKYYAAADKYGQFKDQNAQWEEIRSAYDSMPKFQRDLLKETYPDFSKYMTYRENYFKENQDVADFYHLTDFKAYQQKPKLVQAMDVADYFVTHYGKHPEFNSPWADSVVTDPNVWAQVTAGWDQATYNQFLGAYQGYYQNQADQRAKFHDFLTQLFARRRTVKTSSGTGSVLGG